MVYLLNEEILELWKSGLSKHTVAQIYKRRYNQAIKIIRSEVINRHAGKFISNNDALAYVEKIIYDEIMKKNKKYN